MKKMIYPKIHGSAYDNLLQKNNSEISIEINQTFDICDIFEANFSKILQMKHTSRKVENITP